MGVVRLAHATEVLQWRTSVEEPQRWVLAFSVCGERKRGQPALVSEGRP